MFMFFVNILGLNRFPLYISESYIKIKMNLNFYFHTPLWCLKRFYEALNALIFSPRPGLGWEE